MVKLDKKQRILNFDDKCPNTLYAPASGLH